MTASAVLICAAAGALLSAALPPMGVWPLLAALVPLFALTAGSERHGHAFWYGFSFGLPFFTLYILWLPSSFSTPEFFGPFFWLLYPPLLLALSAFWGLVTWTARFAGGGGAATLALLPPFWILMEWGRTQGYFAFPWGTLGYAWLDTPVAQNADWLGVWGLGLLTTTVAALLAVPFVPAAALDRYGRAELRPSLLAVVAAGLLLAGSWVTGVRKLDRELPPPDLTALLVQGNIEPFARLSGSNGELQIQADLTSRGAASLAQPPDLVVWPEGAVMNGFGGDPGAARIDRIQQSSPESTFLIGARTAVDERSYNSAYTLSGGQLVDRYDKYYLVPFGERFPLAEAAAPLYRATFGLFGLQPLASTSAGEAFEPLQSPLGPLAAYICYESVFPQVQRVMVGAGAGVLVNITNDAWFSRGDGARQHYSMGSMRAIETRRYILRAGLDGITGVVDPLGRTVAELPRHTPGYMVASFAMSTEITPFVRYGHLLVPLLIVWSVVTIVARLFRR